jgi:ribosome recycling factor
MKQQDIQNKLNQAIDYLKEEVGAIRTGQATPQLVEGLVVDVYGSKMKIVELASISVDAGVISISPWDKSNIDPIARAVEASKMGFVANTDSDRVIINVPPLTQERRLEFTKLVGEKVEGAKITIRNIRQDAMKSFDEMEENGVISEDEQNTEKTKVEEEVKKANDKVVAIGEEKKQALMKV